MKLIEQVEVYGLDSMSTGVILTWVIEAFEKGLISKKETMGLKFTGEITPPTSELPTYH
ncbi:MAG: aldehyde ferredoxin oxidoreductase C-terminal domain-containing protein [Nitrospirota bacterium]